VQTSLIDRIDAVLPQTQCTRCGFDGCRPYAEALAGGESDVNRCPPGGDATIAALAGLTQRAAKPLDAAVGSHRPLELAIIDEARCIGCTLCIDACPLDAIIGAPKRMHVVLRALCSGCELCIAPCPVDCIAMVPAGRPWTADDANAARERYRAREMRMLRGERVSARGEARPGDDGRGARQAAVAAALTRARERRAGGADRG
jgi:electron transport complex protein RnfB